MKKVLLMLLALFLCGFLMSKNTFATPEPTNMFLLGTGLLGLVVVGRKKYIK